MTVKQDHIDATFGGKQVRFRIRRDRQCQLALGLFIPQPYDLFQKFAIGTWSVADIRLVLSIAYNDGDSQGLFVAPAAVTDVLNKEPPGVYVPLVVAILEAYLFGIDPERSTFDERKVEA